MFELINFLPLIIPVVLVIMFIASAVRILPEYERGVLFRLGRMVGCGGRDFSSSSPVLTGWCG